MNLRIGVIGAGYFGKHYIRILQTTTGAELAGVAARSISDIPQVPDGVTVYGTADELFADATIDGVIIATPPSTHAELAINALERGKHVLLEKPMAVSVADAERIADMVKKTGCVFMIGHQYCYNDYIRKLKKEIKEGTLGDIKYIFAEHMYAGPVRLDVGCLWETATHELSIIDYLFPDAKVQKITGQMIDMTGSGRDDVVTATLMFENGMNATIFTTWFAPQKVRRMILGGTKGMAVFNEAEQNPLTFFKHPYPVCKSPEEHTSHFFEITEQEKYIPDIKVSKPLQNELNHFIECIREHKIPLTDVEHGLRITELLDNITTQIRNPLRCHCEEQQ